MNLQLNLPLMNVIQKVCFLSYTLQQGREQEQGCITMNVPSLNNIDIPDRTPEGLPCNIGSGTCRTF